ncbi:MAG: PadR family transcriptional regulator [Thermomicrobiales bacterium]
MRRDLQTPLAMSILSFLRERPMHPYEIKHMMQVRHHDQVIKLRGGSLYSTIDRMEKHGFITILKTERAGNRPERTTYALTEEGERALLDWLRDAIVHPQQDYSPFGAVIAFLPHLMPHEVVELLRHRLDALHQLGQESDRLMESEFWSGLSPMFKLHQRYADTLRNAEMDWIAIQIAQIESGALVWPDVIVEWHQRRGSWTEPSAEVADDRNEQTGLVQT